MDALLNQRMARPASRLPRPALVGPQRLPRPERPGEAPRYRSQLGCSLDSRLQESADDIVAGQGFATFGDYPIMAESHISAACKATPRSGPTTIHLEEYTAGVGRFAQMCIDGDGGDPYDVSTATAAPAVFQRGR